MISWKIFLLFDYISAEGNKGNKPIFPKLLSFREER